MSLLKIQNLPTAETSVILLHASDNVAIARVSLSPGQTVRAGGLEIQAAMPVSAGHKIALREIPAGAQVIRYGCAIGSASAPIHPGDHVHTHNVAFEEIAANADLSRDGLSGDSLAGDRLASGGVATYEVPPSPPRDVPAFL